MTSSLDLFDKPGTKLALSDIILMALVTATRTGELSPNEAARLYAEPFQDDELVVSQFMALRGGTPPAVDLVEQEPWRAFFALVRDDPELFGAVEASYRRGVDQTVVHFSEWSAAEQVEEWRVVALDILNGSQKNPFDALRGP